MLKRAFDITFSAIALLFFLPLFAIICILIRLDSRGPVFFRHKRVGKDGKPFMLYKFRSMIVKPESENGAFEPGKTDRVTRTGRFLRKTKIDELPQLINVLKGEMSVVGPRPEVEKWVAVYPERWKLILKVKPGMTDKASIKYRNEESILAKSLDPEKTYKEEILPRKMDLYEEYVLNNSFLDDINLIFNTLASLFNFGPDANTFNC